MWGAFPWGCVVVCVRACVCACFYFLFCVYTFLEFKDLLGWFHVVRHFISLYYWYFFITNDIIKDAESQYNIKCYLPNCRKVFTVLIPITCYFICYVYHQLFIDFADFFHYIFSSFSRFWQESFWRSFTSVYCVCYQEHTACASDWSPFITLILNKLIINVIHRTTYIIILKVIRHKLEKSTRQWSTNIKTHASPKTSL